LETTEAAAAYSAIRRGACSSVGRVRLGVRLGVRVASRGACSSGERIAVRAAAPKEPAASRSSQPIARQPMVSNLLRVRAGVRVRGWGHRVIGLG